MVAAMNHRASKFTRVLATYTSTVGECAACNQSEDKDAQHEEQEMVHVALSSRWQTTQKAGQSNSKVSRARVDGMLDANTALKLEPSYHRRSRYDWESQVMVWQ